MSQSSQIQLLSDQTINQIAAGEVVERAASVVKELVENSLDAGARSIEIRLGAGGRQLIEVRDDGSGMSQQDALLSFERHATSKLHKIGDLDSIATLGFRGEALPSIASISKVELITSQGGEGRRVLIEGGKILQESPAGRARGTTFSVRSLFYNAPARRKFQKAPSQEVAEIHKLIASIALAHPEVEFRLLHNDSPLLHCPPTRASTLLGQLQERGSELLGTGWTPIEWEEEGISLCGWLSPSTEHRPNRTGHYFYINRRPVVSPLISRAITEGYGTRLPTHRYPLFLLHLELPGSEVDVNVHPQKREVRFSQEELLSDAVYRATTAALQKSAVVCPVSLPAAPMERSFSPPLSPSFTPPPVAEQQRFEFVVDPIAVVGQWALYDGGRLPPRFKERFEGVRMLLVDLCAVQGRILFEKMEEGGRPQQMLLIPETVEMSVVEAKRVQSHLDRLGESGFSIRSLGSSAFLVDAVPVDGDVRALLFDSIDHFDQYGAKDELAKLAALRGRRMGSVTFHQASALIEELFRCDHPWEGPLGERVAAPLTHEQMEKLFESH